MNLMSHSIVFYNSRYTYNEDGVEIRFEFESKPRPQVNINLKGAKI